MSTPIEQSKLTVQSNLDNKRNECRMASVSPVSYSYSYIEDFELKCLSAKGISVNLSDSGMCLYTSSQLDDGLDLKIYGRNLFESPRTAVVKWCSKVNEELFKIGITLH